MIDTVKALKKYVEKQDNMYLYGAGKRAKRIIQISQMFGFQFDGCIVSERGKNPFELKGVPVYTLDDLETRAAKTSDLNLFVSIAGTMEELLPMFEQGPSFKSILFCSPKLNLDMNRQCNLHKEYVKFEFEKSRPDYALAVTYPKSEPAFGALIERKTGNPLMRIPCYLGLALLEPLLETGTREALEQEFGPLFTIPHAHLTGQLLLDAYLQNGNIEMHGCEQRGRISDETVQKERIEIYVINSHMDKASIQEPLPQGYIPLQVGAALTDLRKGCLTDDTGDHISYKNRDYCECTGLYWIWKNTSGQDYVGLCHYRRRLNLDESDLQFIREQDIDVIVTLPQYEEIPMKDFFPVFIETSDWKLLKQFVSAYDKEYRKCFSVYEEGHFYFPCNVNLWKREWFDRYCEFAFSIAEKIEQVYADLHIFREDRYMGYLFEQLSSLFIMRHRTELKVACAELQWIE